MKKMMNWKNPELVAILVSTSPRSLRRLAAVCLTVAASVAFALQALPQMGATQPDKNF